jgi:putative nucleotidyltransferase with HDIG domain
MPGLAISARSRRLIARLPPFSPVALRLLTLVSDENVSFKEVAKLLSLDPALSGKVLCLANSGLYSRRVPIQSVLHAIAMLGLTRISQLTLTAAVFHGLPRRTSPWMRDWWRHSVASAIVAEHAASGKLSMDFAYTAGLLHAIGQLALFQEAPEEYPKLVDDVYASGGDLLARERDQFGTDHAELAGWILAEWRLPESVQEAAAKHHCFNATDRIAAAVQLGCLTAEHRGFGGCGNPARPEPVAVPSNRHFEELATRINGLECSLV